MACARLIYRVWLLALVSVVLRNLFASMSCEAAAPTQQVAAAGVSNAADTASAGDPHYSEGKRVHVVFANHLVRIEEGITVQ